MMSARSTVMGRCGASLPDFHGTERMSLCLWQTAMLCMLTVNIGLSPARDHFLSFLHVVFGLSIVVVVLFFLLVHWRGMTARERVRAALGILMMVLYLGAAGRLPRANAFFFVFVQGAALSLTARQRRRAAFFPFRALFAASLVYSAAFLSDQVFLWTVRITAPILSLAELAEGFSGCPLEMVSFTYLGGWLWVVELPFVFFLLAGTPRRRLPLHLPALLLLAVALALQAADPDFFRLWLFVMAASIYMMFLSQPSLSRETGRSRMLALAGSLLAAAGVWFLFFVPADKIEKPSKCVLLDGAYSAQIPDAETPEEPQGAALGRFCRYMKRANREFEQRSGIEGGSLRGVDVLLICNLDRELGRGEIDEISRFVRGGGGLLVFGDHTDISGVMRCTNPLISRFGIKLNFDSAIPLPGPGWDGALDLRQDSVAGFSIHPDRIKISVGASLALSGCSRPLVVARSGFLDRGDRAAPERAFLGNWSADPGEEQLGELILGARARAGKGRVAVFGDTAFLQESSFSTSWPFVAGLLEWCAGGDSRFYSEQWFRVASLVLLLSGFVVFLFQGSCRAGTALPVLLPLLAFLIVQGCNAVHRGSGSPLAGQTAWIDLRGGSNLSVRRPGPADPAGFESALSACGFLPLYLMEDPPMEPGRSDLLVVPSEGSPLGSSDVDRLFRFVEEGGKVLSFVGPADRESKGLLLERLGVEITSIPLGFCPGRESSIDDEAPTFSQAWAMKTKGSVRDHDVVVSCWQHPVVLSFRLGEGCLFLISDPRFLWDRNFKQGRKLNVRNVVFLKKLLAQNREEI